MKKTIAIVDDHVLISNALRSIIVNFQAFEVLYECENGSVLIDKIDIQKSIPDIVLLDISMPVMDGFETANWLKKKYPNILVMALSMQDDSQSVIRMIQSGAKGYLLKNAHPSELERALQSMVQNGFYYPEWTTGKVFASIGSAESKNHLSLSITPREKEFLSYTVTEMSYKAIAEKMFCSPRTVESYRDSFFETFELKTRVGHAVYAIRNGFE